MNSQPHFILVVDDDPTAPPVWSIDERTREIGRRRVAEARELLRRRHAEANPVEGEDHPAPHAA